MEECKPPAARRGGHVLAHGGPRGAARGLVLNAAAQVEIEKQSLKAVHHILVSRAYIQALSTRVSSIQPAPPFLELVDLARQRVAHVHQQHLQVVGTDG